MLKKRKLNLVLSALVVCTLLALQITPTRAAFPFADSTNDVTYIKTSAYSTIGSFHQEIDMDTINLNGQVVEVYLQTTPVEDEHHKYELTIYWHGGEGSQNYTHGVFGGTFGEASENTIITKLYDVTGRMLADETWEGEISIQGNLVAFPIPAIEMIKQPGNPEVLYAITHADTSADEFWMDFYPDSKNTWTIAGSGLWAISLGVGIPAIAFIILRKKRK